MNLQGFYSFFDSISYFIDAGFEGAKQFLGGFAQSISGFLTMISGTIVGTAIVSVVFLALLVISCLKIRGGSFKVFAKTKAVVICALLMAIHIVLGYYSVPVGAYMRFGFTFITQPVVAMLFGPVPAAIVGIIQDLLKWILKPIGAYWPPYALCVGISALIYGLMLYKKRVTFMRVYAADLLVSIFVNATLSSIALAPTVGAGLVGILPGRIIKELVFNVIPVHACINYLILKNVKKMKLGL